MPKVKTHSGTQKRVKVTGNGKLKVSNANRAHLKGNKSKKSIRNNRSANYISPTEEKRINTLLGK